MAKNLIFLFLVASSPLFAKGITPVFPYLVCEQDLQKVYRMSLSGERPLQKERLSRCMAFETIDDFKLIDCRCRGSVDARECLTKVSKSLGINPQKYLDILVKKCEKR